MLNTDDYVDSVIANLKIVGMVQKGGKLCVRKGQLAIERTDHLQGVRRWVAKDSRDVSLIHMRNTVGAALKLLSGATGTRTQARLAAELRQCEVGLQNLQATYIDDSAMVAHLQVLVERITENCEVFAAS